MKIKTRPETHNEHEIEWAYGPFGIVGHGDGEMPELVYFNSDTSKVVEIREGMMMFGGGTIILGLLALLREMSNLDKRIGALEK